MSVDDRPADPPWRVQRSACDRSTTELLQTVLRASLADPDHIDAITRLIDSGQISTATNTPDALGSLVGFPQRVVEVLIATLEIARRASLREVRHVIRGPADVACIAQRDVGGRTRECVLVVVCDASNSVMTTMIVAQGSVDTVAVPVREILAAVLQRDGRAFAIAHNHPAAFSGISTADCLATERLTVAARAVGLRFLGHVVVAGDTWMTVPTRDSRIPGSAETELLLRAGHRS